MIMISVEKLKDVLMFALAIIQMCFILYLWIANVKINRTRAKFFKRLDEDIAAAEKLQMEITEDRDENTKE